MFHTKTALTPPSFVWGKLYNYVKHPFSPAGVTETAEDYRMTDVIIMHDVMTKNYVTLPRRLALAPMFRVILTRESLLWSPIATVYQYLALLCIIKIKMSFILGKGYSQKFGIINTVAWLLHMKLISRFICNWLTRFSAFIMIIYEQKICKHFLLEGLSSFWFLLQSMWEESALKETRNQQQNQHAAVSLD